MSTTQHEIDSRWNTFLHTYGLRDRDFYIQGLNVSRVRFDSVTPQQVEQMYKDYAATGSAEAVKALEDALLLCIFGMKMGN